MSSPEKEGPSDRANKRRRTSSGSATSSSATLHSRSPRDDTRVQDSGKQGKDKGKSRAQRLAGFDDEEEDGDQVEAPHLAETRDGGQDEDQDNEDLCAICLAPIDNKTVVYPCHHGQFCWNCIRAWTDQSRKCPLCLGPIEHLIHNIRSEKDYSTYHLLPLHTLTSSSSSSNPAPLRSRRPPPPTSTLPRHALYGRTALQQQQLDTPTPRERLEEIALERRKYIYREGLYAKHVASNRYTGFKPFSPQIFTLNQELKARVIKFIRRELQVFPAVDVSFLTTYLISIASQLDLRSPAALRLVSDFLSESDAQHLVHEIVTFARSPFVSLEGYDRFIQYGRPEKRLELESMVFEGEGEDVFDQRADSGGADKDRTRGADKGAVEPRFARNMVRRREEEEERHESRRGGRRYSNDFRRGGGGGLRRRSRSRSPPESPPPRNRRDSFRGGNDRPRRRESGREQEPDWRERDERYTGSYYRHSDSRKDRGAAYHGDRDERRARRNSTRKERRESFPNGRNRERPRGFSRSPSPRSGGRSRYEDRPGATTPPLPRSRASPARYRSRSRSRARSRPQSPRDQLQSPSKYQSRRSRSPTPTRINSQTERTPTPPPQPPSLLEADDAEYRDAISLSAPTLSPAPQSPRSEAGSQRNSGEAPSAAPTERGGGGGGPRSEPTTSMFRPTLSIFGAARRLLGNGNVVTFSNEGKIELQVAGTASSQSSSSATTISVRGGKEDKGEQVATGEGGAGGDRQQNKEKRILEDRYRPVAVPPPASLLSRLGPARSNTEPNPMMVASLGTPPSTTSKNDSVEATPSAPNEAMARLKAKLQERLTAEYRQALSKLSEEGNKSGSIAHSTAAGGGGAAPRTDLRALLQSRLQAEKALAYDAQRLSNVSTSSNPMSTFDRVSPSYPLSTSSYPNSSPSRTTTFSQATKDLLLMRLEEERLLAQEQHRQRTELQPLLSSAAYERPYSPQPLLGTSATSVPSTPAAKTLPPLTEPNTSPSPAQSHSELDLKTRLLEKRKVAVEEELKRRSGELKEKLMRDKLLKQMMGKKKKE